MSLFGNLFDENGSDNDDDDASRNVCAAACSSGSLTSTAAHDEKPALPEPAKPPAARPEHGLCGILNRGATCYLNSLLQTLSMTPDFCARLFSLGPDELGRLENRETSEAKVRVIPLELQRLFARLLMLNVSMVTTADLTSSFGWNNHEERDQHDIQELNRILFSAVEESLVGTAGQPLINDLYHGRMSNVIQCRQCGNVSEHDEDFLDLCVSVSASSTLEESLARMFLEPEVLDTSNRYRCGACGQLTDAFKFTKLHHLPPVLTVSLLRFNYDPVKMERFKETRHFEFPLRLDMSRYCVGSKVDHSTNADKPSNRENNIKDHMVNGFDRGDSLGLNCSASGDSSQTGTKFCRTYELFSVVVHRGGAHGGHYHAIIRDMDARGIWSEPDRSSTSPADTTSHIPAPKPVPMTTIAEVDFASPRSLITYILSESGSTAGRSVGDVSGRISSLTGTSWRKKYKPRHGSFLKFLADNEDLFVYNSTEDLISLVPDFEKSKSEGGTVRKSEVNGTGKVNAITARDPAPVQSMNQELDISSPRSVIASILLGTGGAAGLTVSDLCSKISETTGDSWRKRYKPKHGSLVKFLGDNSDLFVHDVSGGWVTLLARTASEDTGPVISEQPTTNGNNSADSLTDATVQHPDISSTVKESKSRSKRNRKKSKLKSSAHELTPTFQKEEVGKEVMSTLPEEPTPPKPGHCWFDFNDTVVRPVRTENITKHFAGKECAYMLFYRAVPATDDGCASKHVEIPDWLISEIAAENLKLEEQRAEYEEFVNVVTVEIHFGRSYECREGVLRPRISSCFFMEHTVDTRRDAGHLLRVVADLGGELVEQCRTIHVAKSLPAGGLHLYQEVTASPASSLKSCGVTQSTKLFVWNGREVDGVAIPVGCENEPISLRFGLETSPEILTVTVAKNTTIRALTKMIASRLQISGLETVSLYWTTAKGIKLEPLTRDLDKTVIEAGLRTRDRLVVYRPGSPTTANSLQSCSPGSGVKCSQTILPKQITVYCENYVGDDVMVPVQVETDSAASVEELKVLIMTSADVPIELVNDVRLRVHLDDLGISGVGPPLHESVELAAARLLDGVTLVLERGRAPRDSEIMLTVSVSASNELELMVDQNMAIHQLLHEVLLRAVVPVDSAEWHLCRSDWTGDSAAVLGEPNQTIGDAGLSHGDRLFLRPGCPPPPGFLRIYVHLQSSPARPCWWDPVRDMAAAVLPTPVGSVVISKQSTLVELKQQTMTVLQDYEVPSPLFLRLQILTASLQPAAILRQSDQTLNKLKIGNGCALGVEVLPTEEDLGADEIVLTVRRRLPGQRNYSDWAQEVIWDTSHGATVASLCGVVADTIGETVSAVRMAKHIPDKFDWLVIPHSDDTIRADRGSAAGVGGAKKKRRRKGKTGKPGGTACDLKSSLFHLQDGDVIGVKVADEPGGDDSDFGSFDDDVRKQRVNSQQAEKSAVSEAFKKSEAKAPATTCRVETAIKIHVDNFR